VVWYQQPNFLLDFYEIQYRSSVQKLLSKREFHDNQLSDSHTLLHGINQFLLVLFIFCNQFWMEGIKHMHVMPVSTMCIVTMGAVIALLYLWALNDVLPIFCRYFV
jgi:lipid-A-disaccharide synthase-like uncharacterized protein